MASHRASQAEDVANPPPFADYFWIAGLDGQDLLETYHAQASLLDRINGLHSPTEARRSFPTQVDTLPEEQEDSQSVIYSPTTSKSDGKHDSYQRLSKLSDEARRSIQSIDGLASLGSNRSSSTIRHVRVPSQAAPDYRMSSTLTDADFEDAMTKFNSDRDTFYLDLNFKDSVNGSNQAKFKARAQKIVADETEQPSNRLSVVGSVKRRISFKEVPITRRPTTLARGASKRASRRISSYNAVIPTPENIHVSPNEHPLKRSFEPVLLDRYPRPPMENELERRETFPDYVPMFAFPNEIQIVSSDSRPPSTWHEFSMTASDNTKRPAVCVVVWIPMNQRTADELEKLCEEWRQANMTATERELASSLAERLAVERAKLSRLLARLPSVSQGSSERDKLEDEISMVEEKINLMADMLRPLRHGAASRIDGLTDGETGLWIPRAYGVIGRDECLAPVWKQWLKAITVPMLDGAVLRVPPSSPKVGMWQPLERYVHNLTCEASRPLSSKIQMEISVRELRLNAKKEALNELPGSRNTDLYPLFRALSIQSIILLFEYVVAEARIILVSSHAAMLKSASKALLELLWPLEWTGVYIPVLPARLMQVLEAPCPYICGVVRTAEDLVLPEDDFVMVDLDKDELHGTDHPPSLPKQQRRKLISLLHLAAPHHNKYGVPVGPPAFAIHTYPNDMFVAENNSVFTATAPSTNLVRLASLSSNLFGAQAAAEELKRTPILNAFIQAGTTSSQDVDKRPSTSSTAYQHSSDGSDPTSPVTLGFPSLPQTPVSRTDSGFALQASLRDKRAGQPSEAFSSMRRKASLPFVRHGPSPSSVSLSGFSGAASSYAPSSYAQSTLAASTIMPGMAFQPVRNTETRSWVEGHCLNLTPGESLLPCTVCNERIDNGFYSCSGCPLVTHGQCSASITVVCQNAFFPDQIRSAFARLFASLFYSYRKYMAPVDATQRKQGMAFKLNLDSWVRSLPSDHGQYIELLRQTQAFNEWIAEREQIPGLSSDRVMLFDALIMAKRGRSGRLRSSISGIGIGGRRPFASSRGHFGSGTSLDFLADTTNHLWKLQTAHVSVRKPDIQATSKGRDYLTIVRRTPAKLEDEFFTIAEAEDPKTGNTNGTILERVTPKMDKWKYLKRMNPLSMNAP